MSVSRRHWRIAGWCAVVLLTAAPIGATSPQQPRPPIGAPPGGPAPPDIVDCGDADDRDLCLECGPGGIAICCWDPSQCQVLPDPDAPETIPARPGHPILPSLPSDALM